jgi:hypothetical protein
LDELLLMSQRSRARLRQANLRSDRQAGSTAEIEEEGDPVCSDLLSRFRSLVLSMRGSHAPASDMLTLQYYLISHLPLRVNAGRQQ